MIKRNGKKVTAKEAAQDLIADKISTLLMFYYEDCTVDFEAMTDKEKNDLDKQMRVITARAMKPCGYILKD